MNDGRGIKRQESDVADPQSESPPFDPDHRTSNPEHRTPKKQDIDSQERLIAMKRQMQSLAVIMASLTLGLIASAMLSGCQQGETTPPVNPPRPNPAVSSTKSEAPDAEATESEASGRAVATVDDATGDVQGAVNEQPAADSVAKVNDSGANASAEEVPEAFDPDAEIDEEALKSVPRVQIKYATPPDDLQLPTENPALAKGDWNQWGGNSLRNNIPVVDPETVPTEWDIGQFDRDTGAWDSSNAKNIRWVAPLGSQTYGNTVVADGKVYVGTNNGAGYLKRYPAEVDLGCLICFDEKTGKFLWQHSSEKLPTGRVHDWPLMGICCSPLVEDGRVYFVTSRGEIKCLDANGYYDGVDNGPVQNELARLFAPAVNDLNAGKFPKGFSQRFADAGFELDDDAVKISTKEEGKSWTMEAKVDGNDREVRFVATGQRLSAFKIVTPHDIHEADTIWSVDMMRQLGISQHNMCSCSVTTWGDLLFVNTSNGVHEDHKTIPAPDAPSFVCMNKHNGDIYWTDNAPGANILHGQWSSPAVGIIGGVAQVIFGGGDGWVYSYKADAGQDGKPELLWKFDINEKEALLELGGRGTKNDIIATPVIYDDKVYFATGQDPEHGEGKGIFWCIDPTRRGDISEMQAVNVADPETPIPPKRVQSVVEKDGDRAVPNPNSGVVWKLDTQDWDGDGKLDPFLERFHRGIGTCAIKDDLLFVADFSGLFLCIDAQSGKVYWAYDMLAASWGSVMIAHDKVFVGDEDGDILIFNLDKEEHEPVNEINMANSVYSTPIMANGVLYIANKDRLFAIQNGATPNDPNAE
jgi:outer membrane protein assembly factor BamB